ncbi:MAG TPA: hypothetical protein VFN78_12605 [Ktedonobacterales bacterium]|nr:hypothetical protein [Ktedonobacterales bacterium]
MFSQRGQRGAAEGPQSPAHDLGRRALFASVGGGVFTFLATIGFQGKYGYLPPIAACIVAVALIFLSLVLLTNADRALAANPALATSTPRDLKIRERYQLITRLEYTGFLVALVICNLLDQMVWLLPLAAIISGAHYLALGRVLRSVSAWAKGAILWLAAVATIAFLPARYPPHAPAAAQVYLWWIVVGFIGGAVFWFDAIMCLMRGLRRRALASAPSRR